MALLKISWGNAIFMVPLFILSHATGTTGTQTVDSHAELATYYLADEARIHRLGLEIRSGNEEWLSEGMRISAFNIGPHYWKKRHLTWGFIKNPNVIFSVYASDAMLIACNKWSERSVSPFTFEKATSGVKPDIRVDFPWESSRTQIAGIVLPKESYELDNYGVTIEFTDSFHYTKKENVDHWYNLGFMAMFELGQALGLKPSDVHGAVMNPKTHPGLRSYEHMYLTQDDINGIREKYKVPSSSGTPTQSYGGPSSSGTTALGFRNRSSRTGRRIPGLGSWSTSGTTRDPRYRDSNPRYFYSLTNSPEPSLSSNPPEPSQSSNPPEPSKSSNSSSPQSSSDASSSSDSSSD